MEVPDGDFFLRNAVFPTPAPVPYRAFINYCMHTFYGFLHDLSHLQYSSRIKNKDLGRGLVLSPLPVKFFMYIQQNLNIFKDNLYLARYTVQ